MIPVPNSYCALILLRKITRRNLAALTAPDNLAPTSFCHARKLAVLHSGGINRKAPSAPLNARANAGPSFISTPTLRAIRHT